MGYKKDSYKHDKCDKKEKHDKDYGCKKDKKEKHSKDYGCKKDKKEKHDKDYGCKKDKKEKHYDYDYKEYYVKKCHCIYEPYHPKHKKGCKDE